MNLEKIMKVIALLVAGIPGMSVVLNRLPHLPGQKEIFIAVALGAAFVTAAYLISTWQRVKRLSDKKLLRRLAALGAVLIGAFFATHALYAARAIDFNLGEERCEEIAPMVLPKEAKYALDNGIPLNQWASDVGCFHTQEVFGTRPVGRSMTLTLGLISVLLVSLSFTGAAILALVRVSQKWTEDIASGGAVPPVNEPPKEPTKKPADDPPSAGTSDKKPGTPDKSEGPEEVPNVEGPQG